MDEFDPAGMMRSALSDVEYRMLNCLMELPAVAMQAARDKAGEEIRRATATLAQRAERLVGILSRVPHNVAEIILAGFLLPETTRGLTRGEVAQAREAFGNRATSLANKACVSYGPGRNPIAMAAFFNGNPAITIGNALYFQPPRWKSNFASSRNDVPLFLHEFTHVIQWDRMGHAVFLRRYMREKKAAGSADAMYNYSARATDFGHEMLEAQAQMVEDQTRFRLRIPPGQERRAEDLKRRLAGSGVYGL